MESRAKVLGHSIHQLLIIYPLGLLSTATIFDALYLIFDRSDLATASFWMIVAGCVGGLTAAPFGSIDWLAIPRGTRAKRIGLIHGSLAVVMLALFATAGIRRYM